MKNDKLPADAREQLVVVEKMCIRDSANINKMGTFRTYTVKVEGNDITFKDLSLIHIYLLDADDADNADTYFLIRAIRVICV